jgi:hypothetical protein
MDAFPFVVVALPGIDPVVLTYDNVRLGRDHQLANEVGSWPDLFSWMLLVVVYFSVPKDTDARRLSRIDAHNGFVDRQESTLQGVNLSVHDQIPVIKKCRERLLTPPGCPTRR